MKWLLYAIASGAFLFGIGVIGAGPLVFQQTAGIILVLIGTTSLGFAVVVGRLDKIQRLEKPSHTSPG